jgi:RimJ/RimL family protein N-acetyltransferase
MGPLDYLHLQLRLEGKALVDGHFMKQVEVVPDEEMPLMLIALLAHKELAAYYDEAISPDLQKELAANLFQREVPNFDSLRNGLRSRGLSFEVGHYKTYVFPSRPARDAEVICFSSQDPNVKAFGFDGFAEKVYAIEQDGKIVSACVSTRENESCGEAWVYTDEAYRHQGFAQKAVNAWAESLMEQGKVPFYSHKIENLTSASLAKKLSLQSVFEEIAMIKSS